MKKIYIVLTYTGTILSKIVKLYTKKEFSHVSIALDTNLNEMYSFGRKNPYLALPAGFVHENKNLGTFKRFKRTKTAIYSMQVTNEQYERLQEIIWEFEQNKDNFHFNILGLITAMIRLKLKRERHLYCAEFVKYVLEKSNIKTNLPICVRPDDFQKIDGINIVYNGILKDYGL